MKFRCLLFIAALVGVPAPLSSAPSFSFSTLPVDGFQSGAPGTTVGYGYTLTNLDQVLWLSTTNLSAGTFAFASAASLFDFPILGPGQSTTVPYIQLAGTGLYEITINILSPEDYVNLGAFVLSADFYDSDPLLGGTFQFGEDQLANYTVVADSTSTPEPASLWVSAFGILLLICGRKRFPE